MGMRRICGGRHAGVELVLPLGLLSSFSLMVAIPATTPSQSGRSCGGGREGRFWVAAAWAEEEEEEGEACIAAAWDVDPGICEGGLDAGGGGKHNARRTPAKPAPATGRNKMALKPRAAAFCVSTVWGGAIRIKGTRKPMCNRFPTSSSAVISHKPAERKTASYDTTWARAKASKPSRTTSNAATSSGNKPQRTSCSSTRRISLARATYVSTKRTRRRRGDWEGSGGSAVSISGSGGFRGGSGEGDCAAGDDAADAGDDDEGTGSWAGPPSSSCAVWLPVCGRVCMC